MRHGQKNFRETLTNSLIWDAPDEQANVIDMRLEIVNSKDHPGESPDTFFRVHAQAVFAYSQRRVNDRQVAEDITAEVFLEAVRHYKKRSCEDPLPWLYGIARRKVADHLRSASRRRGGVLAESIPATGKDPFAEAELSETCCEVRRLVDSLPDDQREALLLTCVEGVTAEQASVAMGRSVASVSSLIQRARRTIRSISKAGEEVTHER